MRRRRLAAAAALVLGAFSPARAQVAPSDTAQADSVARGLGGTPLLLNPLLVQGDRSYSAASSSTVRAVDLGLRPRSSSQDLLRLAPGLVIAQHAGGGKAEQIFLRGFDADHGTDVAISVDGTPVNMVSHAHGQGYADLHFLIPEVVERVEVNKGPYAAEAGDFATAGSVSLRTYDRLPAGVVQGRGGSFATLHGLAMLPFGGDAREPGGYLALSGDASDGPFEAAQNFRRYNVFAKGTAPWRGATLVATLSGFGADWDASGQVPERAVRSGLISRFGAIDATEGGETRRHDASLALRSRGGAEADWELRAYAARYYLDLFSNFTFFLTDSIRGDGIEQVDDRYLGGVQGRYARPAPGFGRGASVAVGGGARADLVDALLARQRERERLGVRTDDRVRQGHGFAWVSYDAQHSRRLRMELGLRGDAFHFDVEDRVPGGANELPRGSGTETRAIASPKLSLALDASDATTLFANVASGFHSNHARDAILATGGERVLPRAVGVELGARHSWSGGTAAAALWALDLESELVYVGDEGITEPSGATTRRGFDLEGRLQLLPWLWGDADLNLSRGRLRGAPAGEDRIPLAPRVTASGGLTVRESGPWSGGARARHIGSRPADETGSVIARGYTLVELFGRLAVRDGFDLLVTVDNLFDVAWNEAQFATTSRLLGEPVEGVTELHYTPGAPRSLQVGLGYRH